MTRYAELKALVQKWRNDECGLQDEWGRAKIECAEQLEAALALPEDSKMVNSGLYNAMRDMADAYAFRVIQDIWPVGAALNASKISASNYLELREASGEPMPYKVMRDGDKVRFDVPDPPKDGE